MGVKASRPVLMVVDDEEDVLRSLHDLLRTEFRLLTFSRPEAALAELEVLDVPVVMSDQRMPGMSGVEFLKRVKALRPDTTRLLVTGYSDIKAVIDAINQGSVFRYISKPWDPEELTTIIRQAVDVHDLIVENRRLVTQLKHANEDLTRANQLKSKFIEVASHELNTPVAIVVGLTELWKLTHEEQAAPAERAWVDRIDVAGKRLAGIVSRMLQLLQVSQFECPLDLTPTEIEPLVRRVIARLTPFLQARHQLVDMQVDAAVGSAEIDTSKIDDALTNLLLNAIKFTADGQTIRVVVATDGPDQVRFQVTDPGVGVSAADRPHLFEPFFTCFDTMKHSSGEFQYNKRGIGLGLYLVKTFVDMHGGTLEFSSVPGRGSTFGFTLPRHPHVVAGRVMAS